MTEISLDIIRTAAKIFDISEAQAKTNSAEVVGHPLYRFWSPIRGAGGIIISADLTYLLYGPQVTTAEAVEAYVSGMRTAEE